MNECSRTCDPGRTRLTAKKITPAHAQVARQHTTQRRILCPEDQISGGEKTWNCHLSRFRQTICSRMLLQAKIEPITLKRSEAYELSSHPNKPAPQNEGFRAA